MTKTRGEQGFSAIEVVVVVAVIVILSAVAIPSFINSSRIYRLNSATTSVQNLFELGRMNAVRRNKKISVNRDVVGGRTRLFVDLAGTGAYVNTDPSFLLPADMQLNPSGAPASSTTGLTNMQTLGTTGCIGFDSRGTVAYGTVGASTCGTAGTAVNWFVSVGLTTSTSWFRAVTVTPMGQAKAWTGSYGGNWYAQ